MRTRVATHCSRSAGLTALQLALPISLLLGSQLTACTSSRDAEKEPSAAPIQVRVSPARRGEISDVETATGETAALSVLQLASPVTGRVTWLTARPGDHLEKDAVAARVLPRENEAAVHGFDLLERAAMPATEHDLVRKLRQRSQAADIALRTPWAADVAQRFHNPGEQVASNDPLLELFDPQSVYVVARVPVESAARIAPGMPVEVTFGTTEVSGAVAALITVMEPQTLTVPLRVSVVPPRPVLLHAPVTCRIVIARHPDSVLVPRRALLSSAMDDHGVLMVAEAHRARRRTVRLGLHTQNDVEITAGLAAGEAVLIDGQYSVPDGTSIEELPGAS